MERLIVISDKQFRDVIFQHWLKGGLFKTIDKHLSSSKTGLNFIDGQISSLIALQMYKIEGKYLRYRTYGRAKSDG